ncbi:hypothetical protein OIE62_05010 [Streptomyces scopuliridis]|uniref:Uncharacterized protein n=1 Tax=Streptomyces scopuliridis TaxID=452529 RepID=A0ACD4ZUU8_9ACTN|nr:hypothetical protein [Streptomyces scopuliridis]WSC02020.1 hypothetical protein OG835_36820 [Streptomyces scopuliridis]WSC04443.1 hypothetical protein OIE62_05010 [Streptomyces scopuliridis]
MRFSVIHLKCETTLDTLRSRHGTITDTQSAVSARTKRNRDAAAAFTEHLLPHTQALLAKARSAIDRMPPARHHGAWLLLLDDLDHAATQIHRILTDTPPTGSGAAREQHRALWPYLTVWAEHSTVLTNLVGQHRTPGPEFTADQQHAWTERAQAAHERGDLEPFESWYDARGRLITLAYLIEDDTSTVLVLSGDLDQPDWHVLGQNENEYQAGQLAPAPGPTRCAATRCLPLSATHHHPRSPSTGSDPRRERRRAQRGCRRGPADRRRQHHRRTRTAGAPW